MKREAERGEMTAWEYLRAHARRGLIVLLIAALAAVLAFVVAASRPKTFEASAHVVYGAAPDPANPDVQAFNQPITVNSELKAVANWVGWVAQGKPGAAPFSREIHTIVAGNSGQVPYTLSAAAVLKPVTDTSWAEVTARSGKAKVAAAAANAAAYVFIKHMAESDPIPVRLAIQGVRTELKRIELLGAGSAIKKSTAYGDLLEQQASYEKQLKNLNENLYRLKVPDNPRPSSLNFRVSQAATIPTQPVAPKPMRTAFVVFVAALVLGIGTVLLLDQRDLPLRDAAAIRRVLGLPLLGEVEWPAAKTADADGSSSTAERSR